MLKHPSLKDLDRFLQVGLPPARRNRITRHLLRCEPCRLYLSPMVEVLHAPEAVDSPENVDPGERYDAAIEQACSKAMSWTSTLREQRARAAPLIDDLLRGTRTWLDLDEEETLRLQGVPNVELLMAQAQTHRHDDPDEMIQAAEMAKAAAMRLDAGVCGPKIVADTRALALAELGNAYRAANRPDAAEEAMDRACQFLERGTGDPHLLARVTELAASLACQRRQFAEACELLDRVYSLYEELSDLHLAGRVLITKSHYLSSQGDSAEALRLVLEGFELLDLKRDPELGALAVKNAILYAVDAGHLKKAQLMLWSARMNGLLPKGEVTRIKLRAIEATIFAKLGELERAELAFHSVRSDFLDLGLVFVAGIAGIDLAAVWMRQGRFEEVKALAEELVEEFRELGIAREALAAVLLLREACAKGQPTVEGLEKLAAYLREIEQRPAGAVPALSGF